MRTFDFGETFPTTFCERGFVVDHAFYFYLKVDGCGTQPIYVVQQVYDSPSVYSEQPGDINTTSPHFYIDIP